MSTTLFDRISNHVPLPNQPEVEDICAEVDKEIEQLRARVAYLEKCLEGRRKLIACAVGWVEEVKCIGEGAEQCKRSFLNELNWAAAPQQEQEGESRE